MTIALIVPSRLVRNICEQKETPPVFGWRLQLQAVFSKAKIRSRIPTLQEVLPECTLSFCSGVP
ncbi:MAG TPA: hypothetical protein VH088_20950, partial [Terriglobales bacterium]|nr:hypothetical protein [Terriglobales bacterium]